jgi:AcrR family transcriptional regulator
MRVRTDERRNAIIEAATEIFAKVGYERASMAMIAERTGGSKTTLYGYFPSKEELYFVAMTGPLAEQGERLLALLDPSNPDVASELRQFGQEYLDIFASRPGIAVTRTAFAEGTRNKELSQFLYQRGPKRVFDALSRYFTQLKERGVLPKIEPESAGIQLKALFEAGIVEPLLMGTKPAWKRTDAVEAAVATFMAANVR